MSHKKPYIALSPILHDGKTHPVHKLIHLTDEDAAHLLKHGVITSPGEEGEEPAPSVTEDTLKAQTVAELTAYAAEMGIDIASGTKKADIITQILALAAEDED